MYCQDPVGKFIDYLRLSRPFADKIYVISHNSRGYDAVFAAQIFGTGVGASIDNGRYQNSQHVCGEFPLFGFIESHAYEFKEHAKTI